MRFHNSYTKLAICISFSRGNQSQACNICSKKPKTNIKELLTEKHFQYNEQKLNG